MKLIIGLGNPGEKYAKTRHNIGFMAVDRIAELYDFAPWRRKFQGLVTTGEIAGHKIMLQKPETYMNMSGHAAGESSRYFQIDPNNIFVLYDELDLPPEKVRVKRGGGAGGHNGIRSLDQHIENNYWRVRIGIGHPGDKKLVHNWVLGDFAKADAEWRDPLLANIAEHISLLISGDDSNFMNRVNGENNRTQFTKKKDSASIRPPKRTNAAPKSESISKQKADAKKPDKQLHKGGAATKDDGNPFGVLSKLFNKTDD